MSETRAEYHRARAKRKKHARRLRALLDGTAPDHYLDSPEKVASTIGYHAGTLFRLRESRYGVES